MTRYRWPLAFLLGWSLTGCNPQPLGDKAPAFGSSPQYSTTAGFLTGHWKMVGESPPGAGGINASDFLGELFLEFKQDHMCEFRHNGQIVHMTWKESGRLIELKPVDVEGVPAKQIQADYEKLMQSLPKTKVTRSENKILVEGLLLQLSSYADRLELMEDKKRLREAPPDGQNVHAFGTTTWVRLDR